MPKDRYRESIPRPMNTITVRMSAIFDLKSGDGGTPTDQFVNATLYTRSLKEAYKPSSIAPAGPDLPLNNYDKFYSVFDLFRVRRINIKFVPAYQHEEYTTIKQENLPPLIISHDVDNVTNYDIKNQLGDAQTKMRDPTRPWKLSFTVPRPPGSDVDVWQNCQLDTGGRFQSGIISINSVSTMSPGKLVGTLYVTYEVSYRERQDTNILP